LIKKWHVDGTNAQSSRLPTGHAGEVTEAISTRVYKPENDDPSIIERIETIKAAV